MPDKPKVKREKRIEVVVRGCVFTVSPDFARELVKKEREAARKEINRNDLME